MSQSPPTHIIVRPVRRRKAHLVFLDECGFLLTPTVPRTFAPRGQKPILKTWDRHDRILAPTQYGSDSSRRE